MVKYRSRNIEPDRQPNRKPQDGIQFTSATNCFGLLEVLSSSQMREVIGRRTSRLNDLEMVVGEHMGAMRLATQSSVCKNNNKG